MGPDGSKLCLYEQIRKTNIAERENAWKEHVKNRNYSKYLLTTDFYVEYVLF